MTDLLPLPPQPAGVPFPTEAWPTADLHPRVDAAALDALLDHAFAQPEPDDLERTHAVVIVQHGAIVAERYAPDAGPDDAFASWSMAKSITQALVGILVRQGRLDIHQPIDVPEWGPGDVRSQITVDQMLRMVDGLRFREAEHLGGGSVRYWPADESDVIPMLFGEGRDDVAAFAATLPKVAEPEAQWNYNSGASNLLSRHVSRIVGGGQEGMEAFMRAELFEPLGMTTPRPTFDAAGTFVGSAYCACSARDFAYYGGSLKVDGDWVQHPQSIVVQPGEDRAALVDDPRVFVPAYLGPSGWIGLDLDDDTDWDEVSELLDASFRLTAPKRTIAELDAGS